MAQNLRASIPRADTLLVYDVNADATGRFAREPGGVAVAATVRELAEKSVCMSLSSPAICYVMRPYFP